MLWNDSYKSGIDVIDRQNFDLVARIGEMMYFEDNSIILKQLEVFEELVEKYFAREQILHDKHRYLDAYSHKISHKVYMRELRQIKRNFVKAGATLENERKFFIQVFEFLKEHIMNHDRYFAHFYNNDPIIC